MSQKSQKKEKRKSRSIYTSGQKASMRSLHFAGFSNKQIVVIMGDVTASAVSAAIREGGSYPVLLDSEIAEISEQEQVGEPRGQLS